MSKQPEPGGIHYSNAQTIGFMIILSLVCAVILSLLASALEKPKEDAKELDRSKQMLIASKILSYNGYFIIEDKNNKIVPAKLEAGRLVPSSSKHIATRAEILEVYKKRFVPMLVDSSGNLITFEKAGISQDSYLNDNKKNGYCRLPNKLIYKLLPNPKEGNEKSNEEKPIGFVIPINGFGLWDAIYGYLALETDGNTVIGITWYDQKETPGLGANISEEPWQSLFPGKKLFQENASGTTDIKTAPLGITVVKGKVAEVLGNSPKSKSAVDGMAGATLTGNGVTEAYRDCLAGYRPFLMKLYEENGKSGGSKDVQK